MYKTIRQRKEGESIPLDNIYTDSSRIKIIILLLN